MLGSSASGCLAARRRVSAVALHVRSLGPLHRMSLHRMPQRCVLAKAATLLLPHRSQSCACVSLTVSLVATMRLEEWCGVRLRKSDEHSALRTGTAFGGEGGCALRALNAARVDCSGSDCLTLSSFSLVLCGVYGMPSARVSPRSRVSSEDSGRTDTL